MFLAFDSSSRSAAAQAFGACRAQGFPCESLPVNDDPAPGWFSRTEVATRLEARGVASADATRYSNELSSVWCTLDGVVGTLRVPPPLPSYEGDRAAAADLGLFLREAAHHARLQRSEGEICHAAILATAGSAASVLARHGAFVIPNFLGASAAAECLNLMESEGVHEGLGGAATCAAAEAPSPPHSPPPRQEATPDRHAFGGSLPALAGRGDVAALPDRLPCALLSALDALLARLKRGPTEEAPPAEHKGLADVSERLRLCEFRSWPMAASYPPGSRYCWHYDNKQPWMDGGGNGRALTCVYYLNKDWRAEDGGALRIFQRSSCSSSSSSSSGGDKSESDEGAPINILAEVIPALDTLCCFWAHELAHEVLPSRRRFGSGGGGDQSRLGGSKRSIESSKAGKEGVRRQRGCWRRAVSVWYLDPRYGSSAFTDGSPLPTSPHCLKEHGRAEGGGVDAAATSRAAAAVLRSAAATPSPPSLKPLSGCSWPVWQPDGGAAAWLEERAEVDEAVQSAEDD